MKKPKKMKPVRALAILDEGKISPRYIYHLRERHLLQPGRNRIIFVEIREVGW